MQIHTLPRNFLRIAATCFLSLAPSLALAQDVSLEVRTKDHRSEYRVGEPIPLQLVFTSNNRQYVVDSSSRYPDLQQTQDDFLVSPAEGASDPMEDFRRAQSETRMMFDMGGLRGFGTLGKDPVVLDLYLNDHVRFSKPGHYLLTIRDRRVSVRRRSWDEPSQTFNLISSPLSLTLLAADSDWQKQQLGSALEALKKQPGVNHDACRILMYLGIPESETAIVDGLEDESFGWSCGYVSLFGTNHRRLLLDYMQQKLENPLTGITPLFVEAMATLTVLEGKAPSDFYQRLSEARQRISGDLLNLLSEKKGPARFAAISTLVNQSLQDPATHGSVRGAQVFQLAAENFDHLSSQAQSSLLSAHWAEIAGPAMVPILRRCAEAETNSHCGTMQADLLLNRLNDLSPADAREVILADMQKENPRFAGNVLTILPDKELPELDGVFRERLQSLNGNLDTTAGLIQRYASSGIASDVKSFLEERELGDLGGQIESNLISYLLRVEPDTGERVLKAALAARKGTGSYKYVLNDVALRIPSSRIQSIAMDALSDPDWEVVQSAVQALGLLGDASAKTALFERFRNWRSRWIGRDHELFSMPGDAPITDDRYLGDVLIRAIADGSGWLLTEEDERRLSQFAVTENQKMQVKQFVDAARNWPVSINIMEAGYPHTQISIAQYSYQDIGPAKLKLAQFPQNTAFNLQNISPESSASRATASELKSFLQQRGFRMVTPKAQ